MTKTVQHGAYSEGYQAGLREAMAIIAKLRVAAASDFTSDNCKGQRGQDRTDALYDAYHAVRKVTLSV